MARILIKQNLAEFSLTGINQFFTAQACGLSVPHCHVRMQRRTSRRPGRVRGQRHLWQSLLETERREIISYLMEY
jgi:hypothetical protein